MTPQQVQAIAATLSQQGLSEQSVRDLRSAYPKHHFTYCSDDDIHSGKPVFDGGGFKLYLVDSSDHCLGLTQDYDRATGLVLAEVYPDADD